MTENKCSDLAPKELKILPEEDCLRTMYEKQANLQERLGRLALARQGNMFDKCKMLMEEVYCLNAELVEMIDRLPFKHWKKYSNSQLKDWENEELRNETLFEYIDALHFFLNIGLVLGFSAEEIFYFYINKNKENHSRQDRGY